MINFVVNMTLLIMSNLDQVRAMKSGLIDFSVQPAKASTVVGRHLGSHFVNRRLNHEHGIMITSAFQALAQLDSFPLFSWYAIYMSRINRGPQMLHIRIQYMVQPRNLTSQRCASHDPRTAYIINESLYPAVR